jgi:hypothetical protein
MTDYRHLPEGTEIGSGKVKTCPYCGEFGLIKVIYGKIFVTHVEGAVSFKDTHEIIAIECPEEGIPHLLADSE